MLVLMKLEWSISLSTGKPWHVNCACSGLSTSKTNVRSRFPRWRCSFYCPSYALS
jgi:hypothetical protein